MNTAYVYLQLYRLFDECTPLPVDCGKLCGSACCEGDDCGMYLFPGEKAVYELLGEDNIRIEKSDFYYTYNNKEYNVGLALCDGECDRYIRPLACRIFPLTPIIDDSGKLQIITDPRAKSVCPLSKALKMTEYNERFVKNIYRSFSLLRQNPQVEAFLKAYTEIINDYNRFF